MKIKWTIICLILMTSSGVLPQKEIPVIQDGPLPGMKFVRVEAGTFFMGSKKLKNGERSKGRFENLKFNDTPLHKVNVKSFQIMTTEVTCEQWNSVMNGQSANDPRLAKGNLTYHDVMEFIEKLNEMDPGKN